MEEGKKGEAWFFREIELGRRSGGWCLGVWDMGGRGTVCSLSITGLGGIGLPSIEFNGKDRNNVSSTDDMRIGNLLGYMYPGFQDVGQSLPASGLGYHNNAAFPIHRRTGRAVTCSLSQSVPRNPIVSPPILHHPLLPNISTPICCSRQRMLQRCDNANSNKP
jgi:hypothetical protein